MAGEKQQIEMRDVGIQEIISDLVSKADGTIAYKQKTEKVSDISNSQKLSINHLVNSPVVQVAIIERLTLGESTEKDPSGKSVWRDAMKQYLTLKNACVKEIKVVS
jgi:hypothetical protein